MVKGSHRAGKHSGNPDDKRDDRRTRELEARRAERLKAEAERHEREAEIARQRRSMAERQHSPEFGK